MSASANPVATIMNMALAYLVSRSLHVATELGIADLLADGPRPIDELAARTGAHRESLYRLLRTLAAHGVFAEDEHGRFGATPASALLRSGVMRDGVLLCGEVSGDGAWWQAVGALRQTVMSGEPAFEREHGMGFFDYLGRHPQCSDWFDRGMANFASAENPAIAGAYDFSAVGHVIDVGGGQGGLLAEILTRHAALRATLFEQPQVLRHPAYLAAPAFEGRWTGVGGDFFESVPGGGDAYLLKRILHDWGDAPCVAILKACRAAMGANARLLVVDAVVPPGNTPHPAKVMDILMMVFATGRERTLDEFAALFAQAGLRLAAVHATPSTLSIIEAVPA